MDKHNNKRPAMHLHPMHRPYPQVKNPRPLIAPSKRLQSIAWPPPAANRSH